MKSSIFKEEFKITRTEKSYIATHLANKNLQRSLYQCDTVGYENNENKYYYKRDGGITYLLAYTKSGQAQLQYDGQEITISPNSLTFIYLSNPSVIETFDSNWEIYFMHLIGSDIDDIYRSVTQGKKYNFENFKADNFISHIDNIYNSYSTNPDKYYISEQIYSLLMDVMRQSENALSNNVVTRAKEYIFKNYYNNISIEKMCEELFVSKYYFIRKFEQETGCTPKQYITELRIQKAKTLLVHTSKSLAEIAREVGFKTEKNIIYAFKKVLNKTPNDFRKNLYENNRS